MSLTPETLDLLDRTREVRIVTSSGGRIYSTAIWVAVSGGDAYIRSVRGDRGMWYQRVLGDPRVTIVAGGPRIEAVVVTADDLESVEKASEGFRAKYQRGRSLDAMLHPDTLHTTLRLESVE